MQNKSMVHNICRSCRYEWADRPGQLAAHYHGCPECGGVYWEFKNESQRVRILELREGEPLEVD